MASQPRSSTQEQVDKLKQAHKMRQYPQSNSPDPLAFLQQGNNKRPGVQLEQVRVTVDEDGTTTVGNYKLGKMHPVELMCRS